MTGRTEAEALRAKLFSNASVYGGDRKPLGGRRRIELRSTSPFRSTSAKYMLSNSRPFPVATKDDMCPLISNRPVAVFGTTLFLFGGRELALVRMAICRPVSDGQPEILTGNQKIEEKRASLSGEERRARILNGNGCAGRRMGKVFLLKIGGMVLCATSPKHKVAPIKYLRRAGIQAAKPAPKNRTCAVPLVKPRT